MGCPDCWDHRLCEMAECDPKALADEAMHETNIVRLSFIAEALGLAPANVAHRPILHLLRHSSPLVREGALYGAREMLDDVLVRHEVRRIASDFRSPALHQVAHELLDTGSCRYRSDSQFLARVRGQRVDRKLRQAVLW